MIAPGKSAEREAPKDGDLHRPLLNVRDHGDEACVPSAKSKSEPMAYVGTDSEKEHEQRRRQCPGPDAAVRDADADDEADDHEAHSSRLRLILDVLDEGRRRFGDRLTRRIDREIRILRHLVRRRDAR